MIRYFIPSDGDDPAHPNVFQLPSGLVSSGEVRCTDVKRHFPLPGRYHFRFKKKFKNAFVWVDMTEDDAVVPACDGVFTAKITRLMDEREKGAPPPQMRQQQQQHHHQPHQHHPPQYVPPPPTTREPVHSGGLGGGGDDLLNMGPGGGAGAAQQAGIPGWNGATRGEPDDLLGMGVFDSAPAGGGGSTTRAMPPTSPPMHPAPMAQMGADAQGVGVGGFGIGAQGIGRTGSHGAMGAPWQQQFARFPPPGTGGV